MRILTLTGLAVAVGAWIAFAVWVIVYSLILQANYCPPDTIVRNFHCYQQVK